MKIEERIARRQRADDAVVPEYDAINPVVHLSEPVGRGTAVEQLLDVVLPTTTAQPTDGYVWGPKGAGKSAVVRPLFEQLRRLLGRSENRLYTSTRAAPAPNVRFVYVDARRAQSAFALLHTVVDTVIAESIPRQGVGRAAIVKRLTDHLAGTNRQLSVAVDHVDEPETLSTDAVFEQFDAFGDAVGCLAVGRDAPRETVVSNRPDTETVHINAYTHYSLLEVLTSRVADGRLRTVTTDEQLTALARWAEGDAHDALAALFGAGVTAEKRGCDRIGPAELATGMEAVPQPCVALGRVVSLPTTRKRIVRQLLAVAEADRSSVGTAADAISDAVDLSRATIERVLYELAESGIIRRVKTGETTATGRPPSRLEPRFPTLVFEHLETEG